MSLSTQQLREDFQSTLERWEREMYSNAPSQETLFQLQRWGEDFEKKMQDKIFILETDFSNHQLQGEYLRSVSEAFDDLDQHLRTHKTLSDIIVGVDFSNIFLHIQHHYTNTIIPLFNILSKLENDYRSITAEQILEKTVSLVKLEEALKKLKKEKTRIKFQILDFNRKKKHLAISEKINVLTLKRRIIQLTLHHDKLNLYYFNHERPVELKEFKERADKLKAELRKMEEFEDV